MGSEAEKIMRPPPADETDLAPDEIAAAATEMEHILEQHPQLSDFGFGLADFYKTHAERVAKFCEDRKSIRDPRSLAESPVRTLTAIFEIPDRVPLKVPRGRRVDRRG